MKGGPGDTGNKYDLTWGGREEQEHQGLPGSPEMPQKSALNPETELRQHWPQESAAQHQAVVMETLLTLSVLRFFLSPWVPEMQMVLDVAREPHPLEPAVDAFLVHTYTPPPCKIPHKFWLPKPAT